MLRVEILEGLHNDVGHRPGRAGIGETLLGKVMVQNGFANLARNIYDI
jgi:hypothetical protein